MQDLTVEQHSTLGQCSTTPYRYCPVEFQAISQKVNRKIKHHALHCSCLVSESTILYMTITLMSAHHSLGSYSPLKTVFWKIGDTYQAYCNTYKTHAMATHHGGLGQPLDRDINVTREAHKATDTDIEDTQDFHPVETDHLGDLEHNNPARLTVITRELDDLCQ